MLNDGGNVKQEGEVLTRRCGLQQQIVKFAKAAVSCLLALSRVDKQAQLTLLIDCINAKCNYLSRVSTDPCDNHERFEIFDAAITRALAQVADESNPDPIFKLLWDLKAGEGGSASLV